MLGARTRPFSGMALAALVSLAPACRGATLPPGSTDPITIGVVLTLDTDGIAYREAIELAVREANAAGGPLPGRRVELTVVDSMYDPALAVSAARRLVDEGAVAILGDGSSSTTLAIARDVTMDAHVPHLSCSATSILLTDLNRDVMPVSDRFFARTAPSDVRQAEVLLDIIRTEAACTRVAIIHQDDEYGRPIAMAIQAALTGPSPSVVTTVGYDYGSASYAAEVARLVTANPDCVALLGYPVEGGIIIREFEAAAGAPMVTWIGGDALKSPALAMEAGSAMRIDGLLGSAPVTALEAPEYIDFRDRLRAATARPDSYEPLPYTANCYDAAALVLLAIADAESTDGDAIRDALYRVAGPGPGTVVHPDELGNAFRLLRLGSAIEYQGASGSVNLNETGDVPISDYEVWRFDAGTMNFTQVRVIAAGTTL